MNFYQTASPDSQLAISNKDASGKNTANRQATEPLAISTSNTSDTSKKTANKQLLQTTESLAIFSERRVYQTRNIISKNKNTIFELLSVSAIEEIQKHNKIEQILKTTETEILEHYFLSNIENKKSIFRAFCALVYFDK